MFSEQSVDDLGLAYETTLIRSLREEEMVIENKTVGVNEWLRMAGRNGRSNNASVNFKYILLRGEYRLTFRLCDRTFGLDGAGKFCQEAFAASKSLLVLESIAGVASSWCLTSKGSIEDEDSSEKETVMKAKPRVDREAVIFNFAFYPCHDVLPYEKVAISVFKTENNDTDCEAGLEILKTEAALIPEHVLASINYKVNI